MVCRWCGGPIDRNRKGGFCSPQHLLDYNNSLDRLYAPKRATCREEGCEKPVRTKRSVYCRDHAQKKRVPGPRRGKVVEVDPAGVYQCHWCNETVRGTRVVVNRVNEDYADDRPENKVVCCEGCHKGKQNAMFFLSRLSDERFMEFGKTIINYRNRS